MNSTNVTRITAGVVGLFVFACGAGAQPLVEAVPGDALVYFGWKGSDHLGAGYEGSHLKAVAGAADVRKLLEEILPQAMKAAGGGGGPEAAQAAEASAAVADALWRHPSALYFGGVEFALAGGPKAKLAVICDAGADAPALMQRFGDQVKRAAEAGWPVSLEAIGGRVVFMAGTRDESLVALASGRGGGTSLGDREEFKSAMAQVRKDAAAAAYVDVEGLLAVAQRGLGGAGAGRAAREPVGEALGLGGLKRVAWAGGFEGKDWASETFILAPSPRAGLTALLDIEPLPDDVLRVVPKSATVMGAGQFDVERTMDELRASAAKIDANAAAQLDAVLQQAQQASGVDVRQLLGSLGTLWVVYEDPKVGGGSSMGMVLVNRLRDAAAAEQALGKLESYANGVIEQRNGATPGKGGQGQVKMVQSRMATAAGPVEVHYLGAAALAPGWAVAGGNLYVAASPKAIVGAINFVAGRGASLLENPQFMALRRRLGGGAAGVVTFNDLPQTMKQGYAAWQLMSRQLGLGEQGAGAQSPPFLPPLERVVPELDAAGSVWWVDARGWHAKSVMPFPGSRTLAGDPLTMVSVGVPSLAISVLLPSLYRARETANRVKCASNLRQIAMACMLYQKEHNGRMPPDLGTLILTEEITLDAFICPSGDTSIPQSVMAGKPEGMAAWVTQNADYVYLGRGKVGAMKAGDVLAYDKDEHHGKDGMNMVFGDGRVRFVSMAKARELIAKQGGK